MLEALAWLWLATFALALFEWLHLVGLQQWHINQLRTKDATNRTLAEWALENTR